LETSGNDTGTGRLSTRQLLTYFLAGLAMVAMLVMAPFFLSAGLMAPLWAVAGLVVVWLVLFVLGCVWFRRRPLRTLPIPVVAALIWYGTMSAGGAWLGWTP
jgi:hypothetical protein